MLRSVRGPRTRWPVRCASSPAARARRSAGPATCSTRTTTRPGSRDGRRAWRRRHLHSRRQRRRGMDSEKNWWKNFEVDVLSTVRGCEVVVPAHAGGWRWRHHLHHDHGLGRDVRRAAGLQRTQGIAAGVRQAALQEVGATRSASIACRLAPSTSTAACGQCSKTRWPSGTQRPSATTPRSVGHARGSGRLHRVLVEPRGELGVGHQPDRRRRLHQTRAVLIRGQ